MLFKFLYFYLCFLITIQPSRVFAQQAEPKPIIPNSSDKDIQSNPKKPTVPDLGERYKSLETLARGLYFLETMYVDASKVQQDLLTQSALKGVVEKLDPHTMILPKKAFEQLSIDTQGKFGGVGIIVSQERGKVIVVSPIEDTPADKAGILSGDEILAIDGMTIDKLKNIDVLDKMRGDPGSTLKLVIQRKGSEKPLEFSLKREVIKVKSVRVQDLGQGISLARITSFQESTASDLEESLKKRGDQLKALVLDLRDNPGGLLDQAVRIVDLFIESGLIVSTVGRDKDKIEREFAQKRNTLPNFPIVVLVNGGSASASEIVAGALQDHERALIVGTTTFGKGSVQTVLSLPDGSALKLTVARYYTPKDRSIQAKGITPDMVVPASTTNPGDESSAVTNQKDPVAADEANKKVQKKRPRKESDLEGHIDAADLSDASKQKGIQQEIQHWPDVLKNDFQLVTAYTYLKGWSLFQKK